MAVPRTALLLSSVLLAAGCREPVAAVVGMPAARFEGSGCIDLAPGVTIDQSDSQADPAREQPIRFTAVFDVPVTGFDASDVVLGKVGDEATVTVTTNDNRTYLVEVSNLRRSGTLTVTIPGSAAIAPGLCNNLSAASTSTDNEVRFLGGRSTK